MKSLAISIVFYQTTEAELRGLLASLAAQDNADTFTLYCLDNSPQSSQAEIAAWLQSYEQQFAAIDYVASADNVGFGRGHNANAKRVTDSDYFLILNQDIVVPSGAIKVLCDFAESDEEDIGVWEMRQMPYEHPKIYHPSTLETGWVTGAACLFRKVAYDKVEGFDPDIFMYAEDVDISWRLQCHGYRCRYVPKAAVSHETYSEPGEAKKTQIYEGSLTNMLLRARYGSIKQMVKAPAMLLFEALIPQAVGGRRWGMFGLFPRYFHKVIPFRLSGRAYRKQFSPTFFRWDYAKHREGAFYAFDNVNEWKEKPKVSILIRTMNRPKALDEALATVANQTYPNVEAVVIEDGPATSQAVIDKYRQKITVQYHALGENKGRSVAGNVAMEKATGEWFNFLDDDDQLFADHVEVLVKAVQTSGLNGAYALGWEVPVSFTDKENWQYTEYGYYLIWKRRFSKMLVWHTNPFPIQTVLFHRRLFEENGGFDLTLDVLEDWDLWIRYTYRNDFQLVEKTTSKYKVPVHPDHAQERLKPFEAAREYIYNKQATLGTIEADIPTIKKMLADYQREEIFMSISRESIKQKLLNNPLGRFLYRRRESLRRVYRKMKLR